RSLGRPALVDDPVTDTTRLGAVTVVPDLALVGTPGAAVDFGPHTVTNNQAFADAFNLFVTSAHGWSISLFANAGGAPGAFIASDSNGDGVWDGSTPNTGTLASGASQSYWVRVSVPPGAAIGTVDAI